MGKIFDVRKKGGNGTLKNGFFIPFFYPFLSHFPLPHPARPLHNSHPVCCARYFPMPPPLFPTFRLLFSHVFPFFQTPKSWFSELRVRWRCARMAACVAVRDGKPRARLPPRLAAGVRRTGWPCRSPSTGISWATPTRQCGAPSAPRRAGGCRGTKASHVRRVAGA